MTPTINCIVVRLLSYRTRPQYTLRYVLLGTYQDLPEVARRCQTCRGRNIQPSRKEAALNKLEKKTEITRTALFRATRDIIVSEGYEGAQLSAIAKRAGRTKGSIYAHFKSKEDLFLATMEYIVTERTRLVAGLSIDQEGEALRLAVRSMCAHAALDDAWVLLTLEFKLFTLRNPQAATQIRKTYNQLWEALFHLLHQLASIAGRSSEEVRTAVEILRALPQALLLEANLRSKPSQALKQRQAIFDQAFDMLFPSQ